MAGLKKVLWCIDPLGSSEQADQSLKEFVAVLDKSLKVEIQPVHVVSSDFFITGEYFEPIDTKGLVDNITKECHRYLKKFSGTSLKDPIIIENSLSARGSEVQSFCEYLGNANADFVMVSSHGRSGWARTFLGSFAESLISSSQIPVIVLGSQLKTPDNLSKALMPIELSGSSRGFVESFLNDHRLSFLTELKLMHKVSMVDLEEIAWAPTLYGLSDYGGEDVLKRAKDTAEKYFQRLSDHPLGQKRLSFMVSESLEPVAKVICEEISNHDLVVMRSEAGSFEAAVLGSVTREVIRQSQRPVIVYPHQFKG